MIFRRGFGRLSTHLVTTTGLLLVMTACGHPVQRKLEGRWLGDSVENFDEREVPIATGWAKGVSLEFSGSSVTVAIPAEDPRNGKYKVASAHGSDVQLAVYRPSGGEPDTVAFKLDSERSIRWILNGGRAIVLRREQ